MRVASLASFCLLGSVSAFSAKFNFGAATSKLPLLFGVEAPGVPMKPGGKYNDPQSVPVEVVSEWADHLEENGVKRTLCLLKPDELGCYAEPGYASLLEERGLTPAVVNVFEEGAADKCITAYKAAVEAGEKIVVHCSGRVGRTGVVMGALLVAEEGLDAETAEKEILAAAEAGGVERSLAAAKVQKLIDAGTLA